LNAGTPASANPLYAILSTLSKLHVALKLTMDKTIYLLIFFFLTIASCKVTEKDIVGSYKLDRFPKTTLTINGDKTFEFTKNNPNPYLHPFDHPDQYYSTTKGKWFIVDKNIIELTSQLDTVIYPLVTVEHKLPRNDTLSYFTFYDTYSDTVKVLYVQYTDSTISAAMHRSMDFFTENLTNRDTLKFHFYGYPPFTFINGQKENFDYNIILKPFFQPGFFLARQFRVKRNKLIDIKVNGKFRRTKSGI
jgi:hypothetical protein